MKNNKCLVRFLAKQALKTVIEKTDVKRKLILNAKF